MKRRMFKTDKFMPLLSDTLPYEVPFPFSNIGFYNLFKSKYDKKHKYYLWNNMFNLYKNYGYIVNQSELSVFNEVQQILKKHFFEDKVDVIPIFQHHFIPYKYSIKKNDGNNRILMIIHPFAQLKICDLYAKYENELLYYTNLSQNSLRHPYKKQYYFKLRNACGMQRLLTFQKFINNDYTDINSIEDNKFNNIIEKFLPNKYFSYEKYDFIYQFYNSKEYTYLEKKYEYCFQIDIKRCFDSIYTHSIAWAIKGKDNAKNCRDNDSFENYIDKIMQNCNWGETHGIPIGSEFSRIFAEIIFQRIDNNITKKIKHINDKTQYGSYKLYRYVDDYFIFTNNYEFGNKIKNIITKELNLYYLFKNDRKDIVLRRPFVTDISSSKSKILIELKQIFHERIIPQFNNDIINNNYESEIDNISKIIDKILYRLYSFIDFIRINAHDNKIHIGDISNIIFNYFYNKLFSLYNGFFQIIYGNKNNKYVSSNEKFQEQYYKLICLIINISFYIFALSPKANSVYNIAKICFVSTKFIKLLNDKYNDLVSEQIYHEISLYLETLYSSADSITENLDLFLILKELGEPYLLPKERIENFINKFGHEFGYFEIVVFLDYIANYPIYDDVKKQLYKIIHCTLSLNKHDWKTFNNSQIIEEIEILLYSDKFMLLFDLISCPYIDIKEKKLILKHIYSGDDKIKQIIDNICGNNEKEGIYNANIWFYKWNDKNRLEDLLYTKTLTSSYP